MGWKLKLLYFLLKQDSYKYAPFSMSDGDDMPPCVESSQWGHYDIGGIWEIITDAWMKFLDWIQQVHWLSFLPNQSTFKLQRTQQ